MDSLQQILARAQRQLRDLTLSQRLAVVFGGLLVAVALAWMLQWAAQPEMVPLLEQNLAAEDLAAVRAGLDSVNQRYAVQGARVMVPASTNRAALLAQLQLGDKLPTDTSVSFDALVREANPWLSQEESDRRWTVALQSEIERVLLRFQNVKVAKVFLNLSTRPRGFSREQPPASASVTLVMKNGEPVSRNLARAAARLVSGAVRGLPLRNVQVVDGTGGAAIEADDEDSTGASGLHQMRLAHEKRAAEKIRSQLAFDPKARVNVQVELDLTTRVTNTITPTDPVDVREERSNEETSRAPRGGQPGVQPNVGVAATGGGGDESRTVETSKTEKIAGQKTQNESKPSGEIQSIFAAINISRSYLESIFRRENPTADAPTTEQIQQIFDREKARVVSQVTVLVKPQTEEQVRVDWYYDALEPAATGGADSFRDALSLAGQYAPHAGLGLLALVSLTLMLRMSKQSDRGESFGLEIGLPREAIDAARKAEQDVARAARRANSGVAVAGVATGVGGVATAPYVGGTAGPGVLPEFNPPGPVGQAAGMQGILEAREVDERTVQVSKMLEQLSDMASGDSGAMGSLLEQWVAQRE